MTERQARWPWIAFAAFVALALVGLLLTRANGGSNDDWPFFLAFGTFGLVGALISSRDRGNRIGLLLLYGSVSTATSAVAGELLTYFVRHGSTGGAAVATTALLANVGWVLGIVPALFFLLLIFPDGRLPSPRWRPFAVLIAVMTVFLAVAFTFGSPRLSGETARYSIANPLYVPAAGRLIGVLDNPISYLALLVGSAAGLVVRFRRSHGVERQQIKWVLFASLLLVVSVVISDLFIPDDQAALDNLFTGLAFFLLPLSIAVAVLRYRLYDLDVVVRKTLLYGLLVTLATAVYAVVVVGAGTLVGRESSFLTMLAAVIVAVGFQPARARLTRVANRLVYGKRATPYEVLSEFSERVGEAYAADDVLPRMARVVGEGVNAEHADVWLKIGDELRVSASWPPGNGHGAQSLALPDGSMPPIEGADVAYPVEHRGELLGALAVSKPPAEPLTPNDAKLVQDLASQAGLVLRNVRLTEELRARLDDLRAAQKRIVAAQDEARRRLERNIHDGAQQQLVALSVKARLARGLTEKDPAKAADVLGQLEADTTDALENLRDLARGIYPPLLADRGLTAALEAQARRAPLSVEVRADGLGRYPQDVEAATYFSVLEALQNVVKYADASHVRIALRHEDEGLAFDVVDDGVGFDPSATGYGTGLQGIADRLSAQDGSLDVRSAPGEGTTISGRIPVVRA